MVKNTIYFLLGDLIHWSCPKNNMITNLGHFDKMKFELSTLIYYMKHEAISGYQGRVRF